MKYEIVIEKSAVKFLSKLEKRIKSEIIAAIDKLADDPRPFDYKKLVDSKGLYRIKIKQYRVIYFVKDNLLVISVVRIAKRGEDTY